MILKQVGVLSCGKICGLIYASLGLIVGTIFTLLSFLGAALGTAAGEPGSAFFSILFGVGAIIILPVFYGFFGFLGGMISAALYNVLAGVVGGIELQMEHQIRPGT